jgi:molecular chaperone GrpE
MSDIRPEGNIGRPEENTGRPEQRATPPEPGTGPAPTPPPPESGTGPPPLPPEGSTGPSEGPAGPAAAGPPTGGAPEADTGRAEEDPAARIADLEDRWRRALADLDNFRKRAARDAERQRVGERARTSAEWLPVLDNLERALEHADADPRVVMQGVRSVLDQAMDVINRLGFPRREDEGQPFDPTRHEAVSTDATSDAPDGTIVQVVRPGYGDGETQLRPAQVVVAKGRGNGAVP